MGTRRGSQRKDDSNAFEAANPFLTRVKTTLEVERIEEEPPEQGNQIIQLLDEEDDLSFLVPKVTQNGELDEFDIDLFVVEGPEFSVAGAIETTVGALFSTDGFAEGPELFGETVMILSDDGFGVAADEEDDNNIFTLNDDEKLVFVLGDGEEDGGEGLFFAPLFGGVEVEVGYMVVDGSGQIEIDLFTEEREEGPGDAEAMTGFLTAGATGSFDASVEDLFGLAAIGVTGSLQVVVTDITVTTNFVGSVFDFDGLFDTGA